MELKRQLRAVAKARRDGLPNRPQLDEALFARLIALPHYQNAAAVMTYVSMGSEPDTHRLMLHALTAGKQLCVPYLLPDSRVMLAGQIESPDDLMPGDFGTWVPKQYIPCQLCAGDLMIVPALTFDRTGHRLGYGGGYYDRFLPDCAAFSVGLCYDDCLAEQLPHEPHDIPVSLLLTERQTIPCRKEGCIHG